MSKSPGRAEYSIAAVSKLVDVSCHILRVWERRYGFPEPRRSESGQRRYSPEQVAVLRQLAGLGRSGRPIGALIDDLRAGRLELCGTSTDRPEAGAGGPPASTAVVERLCAGDEAGADAILDDHAGRMTPIDLVEQVIAPAMIDVGERWFRQECDIFQEHYATRCLLARVEWLLGRARRANAHPRRKILVGTIEGDRHGGGVLMLSLALELAGWRALSLGVDLPVGEFAKAVDAWRHDAVGLSFVLSRNINKRFEELSKIRDVPVLVGGRSIVNHVGLARRYGLIPLSGPLATSSAQVAREVEDWERERLRPPRPGS